MSSQVTVEQLGVGLVQMYLNSPWVHKMPFTSFQMISTVTFNQLWKIQNEFASISQQLELAVLRNTELENEKACRANDNAAQEEQIVMQEERIRILESLLRQRDARQPSPPEGRSRDPSTDLCSPDG